MEAHVFNIVETQSVFEAVPAVQLLTTVLCLKMCFMQFRDMRQFTVDLMEKWAIGEYQLNGKQYPRHCSLIFQKKAVLYIGIQ